MEQQCIFCRIGSKQIPADIVYEDPEMVAFRDIHPIAPVHVLLIPKKHIPSVNELEESDAALIGRMVLRAKELARKEGVFDNGYRLVVNTGAYAGQEIKHLHMHIIGGRKLSGKFV